MLNMVMKRILVLAPHTDDGELGCGATLARFLEESNSIYYVAFSIAEKSLPYGLPYNTLEKEVLAATAELGIRRDNVIINRYEVRCFSYHRQEILEEMIKYKKDINPDLVLMPSLYDIHQDHHTISEEGLRAFKNCTILGYELPWNNLSFETKGFVKLNQENLEKKIKSLEKYESQKDKIYFSKEFVLSWARTRGVQIGCSFAEAFEIIRLIL